jgi:hypothetical protein
MTNPSIPSPIKEIGDQNFPIWLLGDSPSDSPSAKGQNLTPLDPRHPTRHSIWTPISDVIQRRLFVRYGRRLDDSELYIRNAVSNSDYKKKKHNEKLDKEIVELRELLNRDNKPKPLLVLCFGQYAFEYARRAQEEGDERHPKKWPTEELGQQFNKRILNVQLGEVTLLPLLHQYVALQFPKSHDGFSGTGSNYYEFVGEKIAKALIDLIENDTENRMDKFLLRGKQEGVAS